MLTMFKTVFPPIALLWSASAMAQGAASPPADGEPSVLLAIAVGVAGIVLAFMAFRELKARTRRNPPEDSR